MLMLLPEHFRYVTPVNEWYTVFMTPAMAAGVTKRLWEMADIVDVLEAWEKTAGSD
jgi:hypothetical protein